jgi:hypothetical protein
VVFPFASPLLFLLHPCYLAHSKVFHSILSIPFFVIGSILGVSLSCSCSCLNVLKPRLCVPVMPFSSVLNSGQLNCFIYKINLKVTIQFSSLYVCYELK